MCQQVKADLLWLSKYMLQRLCREPLELSELPKHKGNSTVVSRLFLYAEGHSCTVLSLP